MKQFGIPACPYCGKHVNLIRMWTLKREGEFVCPYCGGIANVHHSVVMNVFAGLCALVAVAIFAFTRYILNTSSLWICIWVFLPFAVFFVGSMFLVYLTEPVLRQGSRESAAARRDAAVLRRRQREGMAAARASAAAGRTAPQAQNPQQRRTVPREAPPVRTQDGANDAQQTQETQPRRNYTDIRSNSDRLSATRTQHTPGTEIYSNSNRSQSYTYSSAARQREQNDEQAAELRRKKIELLRRLQQEQKEKEREREREENGQ